MYFLLIQNVLIANKMRTQGSKQSMIILIFQFKHSHTRRKDRMERRTVLLLFSLELEISGVAIQRIHQKAKNGGFLSNYSVKIFLKLFQPLYIVMTMTPTLLRHIRRSLQIMKILRNTFRLLQFAEQPKYIKMNIFINNSEKRLVSYLLIRKTPAELKKLQKLHRKRNNNMVSFIHNGSEITTSMRYSVQTKRKKSKAKQHF